MNKTSQLLIRKFFCLLVKKNLSSDNPKIIHAKPVTVIRNYKLFFFKIFIIEIN